MENGKILPENVNFPEVYKDEIQAIRKRRKALGLGFETDEPADTEKGEVRFIEPNLLKDAPFDMLGIALSGGGIRSATINLGFLKILNENNVLRLTDYMSTVSGGGYTGSYVTEKLRIGIDGNGPSHGSDPYSHLFTRADIEHIKDHGSYLVPGRHGWQRLKDKIILGGGFLATGLLHLLWYLLAFMSVLYLFKTGQHLMGHRVVEGLFSFAAAIFCVTAYYYYFFHGLRFYRAWPVKQLITILALSLAGAALFYLLNQTSMLPQFVGEGAFSEFCILVLATGLLGIFANPNILSPSQIYRFRLEEAFRWFGKTRRTLWEICPDSKGRSWGIAPYPLINATLNLSGVAKAEEGTGPGVGGGQTAQDGPTKTSHGKLPYSGYKTCDYFLLSPFYCGSKLTGFLPTDRSEYRLMTLSTAITISGAALNPEMGYRSSKVTAFFMTLLNLRLGYWGLNPYLFRRKWCLIDKVAFSIYRLLARVGRIRYFWPTYWPVYNLYELFDMSGIDRWRVNLSDGGHIENLGVFELLRRKCRLIIAIDAGADPKYSFSDLKNLVMRARNELGMEIIFRKDPEELIRPGATLGFSKRQFCIADICDLPEHPGGEKKFVGTLVYVKASVTPQEIKNPKKGQRSYTYRLYHPRFPHEPTSDQFFDNAQWEAYYEIGQDMARSLLNECIKADPGHAEVFPRDIDLDRFVKMVDRIDKGPS